MELYLFCWSYIWNLIICDLNILVPKINSHVCPWKINGWKIIRLPSGCKFVTIFQVGFAEYFCDVSMFHQLRTGVELLPCSQVPGQNCQGAKNLLYIRTFFWGGRSFRPMAGNRCESSPFDEIFWRLKTVVFFQLPFILTVGAVLFWIKIHLKKPYGGHGTLETQKPQNSNVSLFCCQKVCFLLTKYHQVWA